MKEWISQIIVFILIAAILDMIIPESRLEKYVRLVMGMMLILLFLKPVFVLFSTDFSQILKRETSSLLAGQNMESIEKTVDLQKTEIVDTQRAYISEQMAVQLKKDANPRLAEKHQAEISDMQIQFKDENWTAENIDVVAVTLKESGKDGTVQKVDKVVIGQTRKPDQPPDDSGIRETLRKLWGLKNDQLKIYWEGGAT